MTDTRISGDEGLYNLCAAVISKAHEDYITGTPNELSYLRQFIRGPLFRLYTLGVDADPDAVIQSWERDRSDHRAQLVRVRDRMEHSTT